MDAAARPAGRGEPPETGQPLDLAVLRFAHDPAASAYARRLSAVCDAVGLGFREVALPGETSTAHALDALHELNVDAQVAGILPMLPPPAQVDAPALVAAIDPDKDVDGAIRRTRRPCTWGRTVGHPRRRRHSQSSSS